MNAKEMLAVVKTYASAESDCLRNHVGVAICTGAKNDLTLRYLAHNGPVGNNKCSGQKGICGCFHAEIRAIMKAIEGFHRFHDLDQDGPDRNDNWIIICNLTPCRTCASFILQYASWLNEWYYEKEYRNPLECVFYKM